MKRKTIIKVLNRYAKNLDFLEKEALTEKKEIDAKQYEFDRLAILEAIKLIENGKE